MKEKFEPYLQDALKHTSQRRKFFINLFQKVNEVHELANANPIERIIEIIECLHASATIIDDMQDNDVTRKEIPCYYKRHGFATASFAALKLWQFGTSQIHTYYNYKDFDVHLNNLIRFQEADTGLRGRQNETPSLDWYYAEVSKKISEELIILFKLCVPEYKKISNYQLYIDFLNSVGQLIQFIDDKKDVLENVNYTINQNKNGCILTYSLPISVLLMGKSNHDIEMKIGKIINSKLCNEILDSIRNDEFIVNKINQIINNKLEECKGFVEKFSHLQTKNFIVQIVDIIFSKYWSDKLITKKLQYEKFV